MAVGRMTNASEYWYWLVVLALSCSVLIISSDQPLKQS